MWQVPLKCLHSAQEKFGHKKKKPGVVSERESVNIFPGIRRVHLPPYPEGLPQEATLV